MVVAKVNFFFQQGAYGWSETYYRSDATLQLALQTARELANRRAALLGSVQITGDPIEGGSPYLIAVRVSDVAVQRDSLLYQQPGGGLYSGWPGQVEYAADHPELALMVRVESGSLYRRTLWLHGIPDKLWRENGYKSDALWLARFESFEQELLQHGWSIRVISKLNLPVRVSEFSRPIVGGPINVVYEPGAGFISGSTVRLSGVRNARQLNREWPVVVLSGIQAILQGSNHLALPDPYLGGATIKVQQIILTPIDKLVIRNIRTREAGVPFDSPVGRRRRLLLTSL